MTKAKVELPFTLYPRDGEFVAPRVRGVYKDGLRHGAWTTTHANGQREQEYHWERGVKHGPELDWYDNGVHCCDGRNDRGKRTGTWTWWYANGQHQEDHFYDEQGRRQGKNEWKNEAGAVEVSGQWLDDKKHGPWSYIATDKFERQECGYDRGVSHGKDIAWYPGGKLAHKRTWVRGDLHGEEERFDSDGKPEFKGEWSYGVPVGTHITWSDGEETRVAFVHGIPESIASDAKLRAKVLKKLAKAKDSYAKNDALDEVDYDYRAAYLMSLWREGHYDCAGDPETWDKLAEASAAMSGEELVQFIKKVKTKGLDGHIVPQWSRDLDKLVVAVYARDPEPLDEAWDTLKGPIRAGVAFVRARFGHDIGDELFDLMPKLASAHVEHYGLDEVLWPDADGVVREVKLRGEDDARTPHFDLVVTWFGGMDAWIGEVRKLMWKTGKTGDLSFRLCRDAIEVASVEDMVKILDAADLDSGTQDYTRRALLEWRNDDVATTTAIALGVKDTGLRKWPAVSAAILAYNGAPIPDALADAVELAHESPTYTSSWYGDPMRAVPEEYRNIPHYRVAYVGCEIGVAVPRMKMLRDAMTALSPAQRKRVVERTLASEYGKLNASQYLYLVDDLALWERALDIFEADTYGHYDSHVYGAGELGARIVPSLIARLDKAKTKEWKLGYRKALLVACARAIADGELPEAWDRYIDFELGVEESAYVPFLERVVAKLPIERAERVLVGGLRASDPNTFAMAFSLVELCHTRPVIEAAFETLLEREKKLTDKQQTWVSQGIAALPDARAYVTWLLQSGAGGGLGDNLKRAIGWNAYDEIEKELEAKGVERAPVIDDVEKLRMLAEDAGGKGERIYILRRFDFDDDRNDVDDGTLNVIGGDPPGIGKDRWPLNDGEPMAHLFTLDVKTMPELAAQVGKDTRAVSVFCWNPGNNEAFEPGNDQTAIVTSTEAEVAKQVKPHDDAPERTRRRFQPVAIEVDPSIWSGVRSELAKQIYVSHARVLGEPQWLQSDDGPGSEGGFVMQFDERFVDINLGDTGVMYVYLDDAFWQCH